MSYVFATHIMRMSLVVLLGFKIAISAASEENKDVGYDKAVLTGK